jgi:hypothetical protein
LVIAVVVVVILRIPAQQVQPVIEGLLGLVGLSMSWDLLGAKRPASGR